MDGPPLLEVQNLVVEFPGRAGAGAVRVVDGVSLALRRGETLALVGESGAGKSMTGLAVLGLVPWPGRIAGGAVRWKGRDLVAAGERAWRPLRGAEMAMIFQEPAAMMNPVFSVGDQIAEVIRVHRGLGRRQAAREAVRWLERVRVADAARRARDYPRQFSGGMLQRVMIAQAMACAPDLLVADEPTTALDAAVQRQIMELLDELQRETGLAVLLVSHNLGLVAEMADRVTVLQSGRMVEEADVFGLFETPQAGYTRELLAATPRPPGA